MAGSLLQRQESQVLCVVAGWHLAHFETHLMGPRNYPTFPHSWHLPTVSTDTTGVFARDWGRGAAHADEAIKTVGARDNAQADHRRDTGEASAWYSGDQRGPRLQVCLPLRKHGMLSVAPQLPTLSLQRQKAMLTYHSSECWILLETKCCGIEWGQKTYMT